MARNLFKKKVLKINGFHQVDHEPANLVVSRKRRRNARFHDLGKRRQQQIIANADLIFGANLDTKIAYAKSVLKKAGIRYDEDEGDIKEKNLMLALSAQAKTKLTRNTYESLRFSNLAMNGVNWPSWVRLLQARKQCCPEQNMKVDPQGAFYNIRDVILHTSKR